MIIKDSPELQALRSEFRIYYQQKLKQQFAPFEAERKKYLRYFWILSAVVFLVLPFIIALCLFAFWERTNIDINLEAVFAVIIGIVVLMRSPSFFYRKKIKGHVMNPMIGFFGDFSYSHGRKIDENVIASSKLFSDFDSSSSDDYLSGKYKDIGVTISEEKHKKIVETKRGSSTQTVFKGVIIILDMNKSFEGQTVVKKDKGWLLNKCRGIGKGQNVRLEDVVFEKQFEVWSDNQIEARYLLTAAFMERMLKVRDAFNGKTIEFSFFDDKLLIKMDTKKDLFEPASLFVSATDYNRIEKAFEQFYAVFSIIDMLKLSRPQA